MAAITDLLTKVGSPGTVTSLQSPGKAIGAGSINIGSATNWPTDTAVYFAIRRVDATLVSTTNPSGLVAGTYTEWKGTVSGTIISNLTLQYGTDQVYSAGVNTQVFIVISSSRENAIVTWGITEHDQLGHHTAITATSINVSGAATFSAGAIAPTALATAIPSSKLSNAYKFSAWRSGALSLPAGANTKIPFENEEFDTGSNFDTTINIGRFTATVAGFYRFEAAVGILTAGSFRFNAQIFKNGSAFKTLGQVGTAGGNCAVGGSVEMQLAVNDYVEVYAFHNDAGANNANVGQANTWFMGSLVSAT